MSTLAIQSTGYQALTLDQLHESSTNPRRTFEPNKLAELAESLRTHGLIQPITVRPHNDEGFEIVAGARRFRAAQIAGLDEVPVRILNLTDEQTVEIQIVENNQRIDVHPYEEAAGYELLLAFPGYDVAAIAGKCGKSQSHIYARLALLQLVPEVAEAFQHEKITASHANLIARLPKESQAEAFAASLAQGLPGHRAASAPCPAPCRVDSEAETAFVPAKPKKTAAKAAKASTPIKAAKKAASERSTAKKRIAA